MKSENHPYILYMGFGANIRQLRQERGWTQLELAEKLGISQKAITSYEREAREPNLEKIQQLAKVFEIPIEVLFGQPQKKVKIKSTIHGNSRMSKMQTLFQKLRLKEQQLILTQLESLTKT